MKMAKFMLVGGFNQLEKYWSMGRIIPYIMENKKMIETTNQYVGIQHVHIIFRHPMTRSRLRCSTLPGHRSHIAVAHRGIATWEPINLHG